MMGVLRLSIKVLKNQDQKRRTRKILKSLKNHRANMGVFVNVRMSKIMCKPIKIGVRTYVMHTKC